MGKKVDDLHDSDAFRRLRDVEKVARRIFYNSPDYVPGPLQLPAFARETLLGISGLPASAGEVAELVRVRTERHAALLSRVDGEDAPEVQVVLDEAVLRRAPGGSATMRQQIEHLIEISRKPTVRIGVILLEHGPHPGLAGSFEIHDGVVFIEGADGDRILESDSAWTGIFQDRAADLMTMAAWGDEARNLMAKLISG